MEGNMNNVQRDPFAVRRDADMRQLMTTLKELQEIDVSNMTPLDALNTLYRLQNKLKNRWH